VEDPGNGYFSVVGLQAPASANAHRVGTLMVLMAFDRLERGERIAGGQSFAAFLKEPASAVTPIPNVCDDGQAVCLTKMKAHFEKARHWQRVHQVAWAEYVQATRLPRFVDRAPGAQSISETIALFSEAARFVAVSYWVESRPEDAFSLLEQSVHFCRTVLEGTVALVVKMAAQTCIQQGWVLAAQMVLDAPEPILSRVAQSLDALERPILPYQMALGAVVETQASQALDILFDSPQAKKLTRIRNDWFNAWIHPFFLPNQTLNQFFDRQMAQRAYDRMTHQELARMSIGSVTQSNRVHQWWSWLRGGNPIGSWLLDSVPSDALLPYALRVRALESQRRLLVLVRHCVRARLLPSAPQACASDAPEALRNPFDGAAPEWVPAENSLVLPVRSSAWDLSVAMPMIKLR